MMKSNNRLNFLRKQIDNYTSNSETNRLMLECRNYQITSAYAVDILKHIYPNIKQSSTVPIIVIEWINNEYLLDKNNRTKYLNKIPDDEVSKYEKYRAGREIKVRYRFKDMPKKYQEKKLAENYCNSLIRYIRNSK